MKKEDNKEIEEYLFQEASKYQTVSNMVLKFKDGKLAFAGMRLDILVSSFTMPYKSIEYNSVYTFGGQTVETPDLGQ